MEAVHWGHRNKGFVPKGNSLRNQQCGLARYRAEKDETRRPSVRTRRPPVDWESPWSVQLCSQQRVSGFVWSPTSTREHPRVYEPRDVWVTILPAKGSPGAWLCCTVMTHFQISMETNINFFTQVLFSSMQGRIKLANLQVSCPLLNDPGIGEATVKTVALNGGSTL